MKTNTYIKQLQTRIAELQAQLEASDKHVDEGRVEALQDVYEDFDTGLQALSAGLDGLVSGIEQGEADPRTSWALAKVLIDNLQQPVNKLSALAF
jgi:soluble cytochrome b562